MKVRLFDGTITLAQQAILVFWSLMLISVVALWVFGSFELLNTGVGGALLSIGRLMGLLATFFALTQFMLMGRISWIENNFGLDRLASFHRLNGYLTIIFIILHPIFIVASYSVQRSTNYFTEYVDTILNHPDAISALVSQLLFLAVVGSSIYIARKKMRFETWYYVHLLVYLAIVLAPLHQFAVSPELAGSSLGAVYWVALYLFVGLNVFIWRFGMIAFNYFRFRFIVTRVKQESSSTISIYIKGRNIEKFGVTPGQFIMIRVLTRKFWWQEHPFTVSWIPKNDELRLTIRKVGDYTEQIQHLSPGARVAISGPFGRFTEQVALKQKRLFIAGGVGITPIRSMLEEAVIKKTDSVLLYSNRNALDVPLKKEIDELAMSSTIQVLYAFTEDKPESKSISGRLNGEIIKMHVPDISSRDVYICGPSSMMEALSNDLTSMGISEDQIHMEQFAFHA